MTETQGPSSTDEQQDSTAPGTDTPQPGVDRANLRNYERLHRSLTDRKVAGVAGGLGRHLNIDPTILRVLFVVLCFFGGAGFVLYGAAWLLVPEDGQVQGNVSMSPSTRNGLLIGAGVIAALLVFGDSWGGIGFPWPLLLVGVGVLVYLAFRGQDARPPRPAPPAYAGAYPPADAPASGPAYDPSVAPAYGPPAEGQQVGYPAEAGVGYADQPPAPPWTPTAQPAPAYQPQPQPRPKRGPKLFGFTLALVAVALGVLGLVDASGVHVVDSAYPALALAVIGLMLVVGAWVGRAGGLILLGIVAALALAVTSIVGNFDNLNFRDSKRVHVAPISAAGVRSTYDITSGRVVVDLSRVSNPQALDGRTIDVGARAGELVVVLPRAVESDVTAGIDGPGQIDFPDRSSGGINTDLAGVYGRGPGTVTIVTHLSAGHIDVRNP